MRRAWASSKALPGYGMGSFCTDRAGVFWGGVGRDSSPAQAQACCPTSITRNYKQNKGIQARLLLVGLGLRKAAEHGLNQYLEDSSRLELLRIFKEQCVGRASSKALPGYGMGSFRTEIAAGGFQAASGGAWRWGRLRTISLRSRISSSKLWAMAF
jgi:hypothetical protein